MRVSINGKIYNADDDFIAIIFDSDSERKHIANQITEMEDKAGIRAFMIFPDNMVKSIVDEQIEMIKKL